MLCEILDLDFSDENIAMKVDDVVAIHRQPRKADDPG